MKAVGVIVEYNPFHNGHIYHLNKARELTNADVVIAVMSGNYCQRGDLSVTNKFAKTRVALENGVDLIVELPVAYTLQNAYVFGKKAVEILEALKCSDLVFGSETGNLQELGKYAELSIDVTRLKELMHDGSSYPKAYGLLAGALYPNDILAVSYLKALKGKKMKAHCIKRTNDYHGLELAAISSASAIRKAILENKDYQKATPMVISEPVFNKDLYPYLQRILLTRSRDELKEVFLVDEGIEKVLKDNAYRYNDYEAFINASISRRYTRSRIQRIIMHIMLDDKKEDIQKLGDETFARILGFGEKGREYLSHIKKDEVPIITQFKNIPAGYKDMEWKASLLYSTLLNDKDAYLKQELKGPIII